MASVKRAWEVSRVPLPDGYARRPISLKLAFAPHAGSFVAANRFADRLPAICRSAGAQGEHRIVVFDDQKNFAQVTIFPMASRTRSGSPTSIQPAG